MLTLSQAIGSIASAFAANAVHGLRAMTARGMSRERMSQMPDGGFDPVRLAPAVERSDYTVDEGRGLARGVPQAQRLWPASGAVPRPRLVEFGAVVVRSRGARRRVLDDERLRRARLRRVDDGPRELRPLVAHRGQFRHRQRRRRPYRRERAGDARDRAAEDAHARRVFGRAARRRLRDGAAGAGRPADPQRLHLYRPQLADTRRSAPNSCRISAPTTAGCATAT